jgi:hypothetical protein
MLEIYANNGKIDLPEDVEVTCTWENPFFIQDKLPILYSINFNIPPSPGNLSLFKHPNRLTSVGAWNDVNACLRYNGLNFSTGKLVISDVENNMNANYVGMVINYQMKKKLSELNSIEDFLYQFGDGFEFDFYSGGWANIYKNTIITNLKDVGNKFAACPIRVKDESWEGRVEGLFEDYNLKLNRGYLNPWNVNAGNFLFTDASEVFHGIIYPQPYIHYLLSQIFGTALNDNFFNSNNELKTLALITSFHKNFSYYIIMENNGVLREDYDTTNLNHLLLSSFMPRYDFNELLKNILKIFCCTFINRQDGKVDIVHNQEIIDSTDIVDWTDKLVGTPVISFEQARVYNSGYQSETPVSAAEYPLTRPDIDSLVDEATTKNIYRIQNTGESYEKKLKDAAVPDIYMYERKASNLGANPSTANDTQESYDMISSVKPIPMTVDEYWWQGENPTKFPWYIPEFPGDRFKNDEAPYIGFNRGFYDFVNNETLAAPDPGWDFTNSYPFMTPYNRDMSGNRIGEYSLAWEGSDGLLSKFHSGFKSYIESGKHVLKGDFNLTEFDLKALSPKKKYMVRGMLFYYVKVETTLKVDAISISRVELREA